MFLKYWKCPQGKRSFCAFISSLGSTSNFSGDFLPSSYLCNAFERRFWCCIQAFFISSGSIAPNNVIILFTEKWVLILILQQFFFLLRNSIYINLFYLHQLINYLWMKLDSYTIQDNIWLSFNVHFI